MVVGGNTKKNRLGTDGNRVCGGCQDCVVEQLYPYTGTSKLLQGVVHKIKLVPGLTF